MSQVGPLKVVKLKARKIIKVKSWVRVRYIVRFLSERYSYGDYSSELYCEVIGLSSGGDTQFWFRLVIKQRSGLRLRQCLQ